MRAVDEILELFKTNKDLSVKEIVERLGISKQTAHMVLNRLVDDNKVEKLGRPPKTVYRVRNADLKPAETPANINEEEINFLNKNFLVVTETGNLLEGITAFSYWCAQRKLPPDKTLLEYLTTKKIRTLLFRRGLR